MRTEKKSEASRSWPEPGQFKRSIRLEFSLYTSAILLLVMAVTGYVITDQYVDTVTGNVIDKLLVQARSYSSPAGKHILATAEPDALLLNNICRRLSDDNSDVYWVGIAGTDSVCLAHTDLKQVIAGSRLTWTGRETSYPKLRTGERLRMYKDTITVAVAIEENGIRVGTLHVASSNAQIIAARHASIISVVSITALILLVAVPLTMALVRRKLRPLAVITNSLKQVNVEDIQLDLPVAGRNELGYLAETLRVMGDKLNLAQRDLVEKERIARELEIAREIQANILPKVYPKEETFDFYGAYRSAREVGGDYYDFVELDHERIGFLVADVSGKSLPGMLMMLLTRDIVNRLARSIDRPAEMLTALNRELLGSIKKGMFVTMFFGVLNKRTGFFQFASAGHNPLIHISKKSGTPRLIKTRGYPLGLMSDELFQQRIETGEIELMEGEWLIQYTDGINEAQNVSGEEFGMDRFLQLLKTQSTNAPQKMTTEILSHLEQYVDSAPQSDDITLLVMKWSGHSADIKNRKTGELVHAG